jgi:peptide chain release factor subunit 1
MGRVIDREKLERLANLRSDDGIVSLYLRFEPRLLYERGIALTAFKSAWKRFELRESSEQWKEAARRERGRLEGFLSEWSPITRGIATFACEPAGLWEAIPLAAPLTTRLSVDSTTWTRPLAMLLDESPRFAACVVQRDKAALYVSQQRESELAAKVESEVPGRHHQGGWSQARFERHREFHVDQHLDGVIDALVELYERAPFDRLILGGTVEITNEIERRLPAELRSRLIDRIPVDVKHESREDILEKALASNESAERREEQSLVETIVEEAGAGGRGALGLEATLGALLEGRVDKMVLIADFERTGWECGRCPYVSVTELDRCPLCASEGHPVPNVADVAVERVILGSGGVNFIFEGPAHEILSAKGGVGALLRF